MAKEWRRGAARLLADPGCLYGRVDGALEDRLVQVGAADLARFRVAVGAGGGEDPLPGRAAGGIGVLSLTGRRNRPR